MHDAHNIVLSQSRSTIKKLASGSKQKFLRKLQSLLPQSPATSQALGTLAVNSNLFLGIKYCMNSSIFEKCTIEVKEPANCSDQEFSAFYEKVKKGGKVALSGLTDRIKNCELLAFCYCENSLIGISAIKRPTRRYIEDIIKKTGIDRKVEDLHFEIGYSFTEPDYRKNGISTELKRRLLEQMKSRSGIVFSTTAIKSSQNFLEENGFKKCGKSYDGENDKEISYYEKN